MCGIIGAVNCKFESDYLSIIKHRGPDDSGTYQYQNVQLGHVRLSILDTSDAGHQPMITGDGNYIIIFNGEIYNHSALRKELVQLNFDFKSGSDTETLLKAWQCWGTEVLHKLNGIYAFAIFDKTKNKLFIVRDHFGIKPLYIYRKGKAIAFSSELKVFEHLDEFDDTLDPAALTQYLSFLWAPGEKTMYQYVKKLLPGRFLEIPLSRPSNAEEKEYYQLPFQGDYFNFSEESHLINELDQILQQSVERQLLSDVPLGFFLSGGLDSSLLVGIAKKLYPNKSFDCFTIDSNMDKTGEGFVDDLPYAQKVAKYLDVNLHVIPANSDIINQFDEMVWHLDEPQADPAPINVYNISKGARNLGIKVLLGGTAGDDLFSGYRRHQALKYEQYTEYIPLILKKLFRKVIKRVPSDKAISRRLQKLTRDWGKEIDERMIGYFNWMPNDQYVFSLFQNNIINGEAEQSIYSYFEYILDQQSSDLKKLDKLLFLELKTFLVDHNLNYTDKMSMAAGVEARVPYLDKDLVSFAGKVPVKYKLRGNETKYLLKKVAERYLPKEVIYRSKTGFGAPIRGWLKNDLKPMVNERLNRENLSNQGIFDPQAVQKMIRQNDVGEYDFSYNIWSMLAIQSWLEQFKWSL